MRAARAATSRLTPAGTGPLQRRRGVEIDRSPDPGDLPADGRRRVVIERVTPTVDGGRSRSSASSATTSWSRPTSSPTATTASRAGSARPPGERGLARGRDGRPRQRPLARDAAAHEGRAPRVHGRRLGRRVRDLAPRPRATHRGRRGVRGGPAIGAGSWSGGDPRRRRDPASSPRSWPRRPPRRGAHRRRHALALEPRARRAHAIATPTAASRRPGQPLLAVMVDPQRARFSAWYELFPRSASPTRTGTARSATSIERLPYVAELGFDVLYLPPIHPIGAHVRKGRNNSARGEPRRPGQPVGDRRRRGRPHGRPPRARHARRTSTRWSRRRGEPRHRGRARHRLPVLARPPVGHASTRSGSGTAPTARSSTPRTRRRSTRTSTRSTSRPTTGAALWDELRRRRSASGSTSGVRDLPRRQPAHQAVRRSGSGDRRGQARPPGRDLPRRGVHPAEGDVAAGKLGFTQSYTYFTWRNAKWELQRVLRRSSRTPPVSDFFRPNFWPNTPDILTSTCSTAAGRRSTARLVLAATLVASYGIYGRPFELLRAARRASRAARSTSTRRSTSCATGTSTTRAASRDLIARVNRSSPRAPGAAAQRARCASTTSTTTSCSPTARQSDGRRTSSSRSSTSTRTTRRPARSSSPLDALGLDQRRGRTRCTTCSTARATRWHGRAQLRASSNPHVVPAHVFALRRAHGRDGDAEPDDGASRIRRRAVSTTTRSGTRTRSSTSCTSAPSTTATATASATSTA